jgi:hypothetical protein
MKWLTAVFILLLLMLAAIPAAIDAANGWMARRHTSVQAIDYLARDIDDLSASRRRAPRKASPDPAASDKSLDDQGVDEPLP